MKQFVLFLTFLILVQSNLSSQYLGWRRIIDKATFDISVNPRDPNKYIAGGEGRLIYRSYDAGKTWDTVIVNFRTPSGRFNNVLIHPVDTNIVIIGGLNFNVIERSTDGGLNWDVVLSKNYAIELNGKSMMFKPDAPDTLYAGDFQYAITWRSTNKGLTWDSISQVTRNYKISDGAGGYKDTVMPTNIGAVAIRHDSTNVLVFGSMHGEMFISTDGGYTWNFRGEIVKPDSAQFDCEFTRIVFSDRDPKTGYACITYLFSLNKSNGGLYQTTDGGWNWKQIAFPDTSIWALACRGYGQTDEIFIGGYSEDFYVVDSSKVPGAGIVRRSQDGGKTWWSYDPTMDWFLRDPKSNANINSVWFASPDTGFAVGQYGVIMRTVNGGVDWSTFFNPGKENLTGAVFFDRQKGFISAASGDIFKTTNGGAVINKIYSDSKNPLYSICYSPNKNLYSCGANGVIVKSVNDGTSWQKLTSNVTKKLNSVYFIDDNTGWAVGELGTIIYTTDAGNTWLTKSSNTNFNLNSVYFTNTSNGFIVGDSATLLKSNDAGLNWTKIATPIKQHLKTITFSKQDLNIGYTGGMEGMMLKTDDAGQTWNLSPTKISRNINSLSCTGKDSAIAGGQYLCILNTVDGGKYWYIPSWGSGPLSNMWSLRYLGEPGNERLFLASEAGLFVLDYPSYIEQLKDPSVNNGLTANADRNSLKIKYNLSNVNSNKVFVRLCDIEGRTLISNTYNTNGSDIFELEENIMLMHGAYICQLIEEDKIRTRILIVE